MLQSTLEHRHRAELQDCIDEIRMEIEPRMPRWSRNLLNQRKIQEAPGSCRIASQTMLNADKTHLTSAELIGLRSTVQMCTTAKAIWGERPPAAPAAAPGSPQATRGADAHSATEGGTKEE